MNDTTLVKKKAAKKIKKQTPATLKRKLWELCKQLTRTKYGRTCYTCGRTNLDGSNWQTGHFIPSGACGAFLRYDLRNLRPQCYNCNVNVGGNGAMFYRNMVKHEGQAYVDQLFKDKNRIVKADVLFYQGLIDRYQHMLDNGTF